MIHETCVTLALHIERAKKASDEVRVFAQAFTEEDLDDFEKVKVIDSFILRFIKTQDLMGNKLFREVLDALGEYESSMSMLDVLDRLEKLRLLPSAELWMDYRNLRNTLTHEYPDNRAEVLEGIQIALNVFHEMMSIYDHILITIKKRNL